jgi:MFS transporter, ACS family, glucarate transporter
MKKGRRLRVRYLLAFWLFVLSAVAFLDRTNISIAGLQISRQYGLGNQGLGWIFSAFLIGYAGLQVPAGWLSSRWGPRRILTLGVLFWGLTTAVTAMLPSTVSHALLLLIGIRFVLGASEAVVYPAANQFMAGWIPMNERGFINGLIFAGVGAGSGLTPPLLNWLITHYSWRAAFWFSALLGFAAAIVWWKLARDLPTEHPAMTDAELAEIQDPLQGAGQSASGERPAILWKEMLHRRDLLALVASYFSFGYIAWIYFSWFFLYMAQVRGVNLKTSAYFAMLPFLSMTVCCLVGGALSDMLTRRWGLRIGRCGLASVALLATAAFLLLGAQLQSARLAGVVLAGGAGALYIAQSSYWSVSVDISGSSSGVFSSIMNMGGQIGGAITASLTPWIAQRYGWTTSFAVAAGLALCSAGLWLTIHPDQPLRAPALTGPELAAEIPASVLRYREEHAE